MKCGGGERLFLMVSNSLRAVDRCVRSGQDGGEGKAQAVCVGI